MFDIVKIINKKVLNICQGYRILSEPIFTIMMQYTAQWFYDESLS